FVFSRLFSDSFTVDTTAKKIKFKPPCYFYVASANDDFIQSLANGLFLKKDLVIGMNTVITKSISVVNSDVENNEIKVKTLSPIVVRSTENGKSFYYKPVDGEWVRKVKENLARKYFAFCGVKIDENEVDIRVIRHSKEVTTFYKNYVIKGYDAILYIKAEKDILQFIVQTGLGEKNSMGFGFVVDLR
ncbi:MAG: CRISPR-associated endoribonuclease Cas6, partial [Elusimicrobiota bacterium]|nr:CRISPR-associated endoribonuclease Cas6 [Endomicrobiia bacterium]MDW8166833.1 CRISPR-associated endoribonuclease Cas6 [Elusimicrobiota bacterium]